MIKKIQVGSSCKRKSFRPLKHKFRWRSYQEPDSWSCSQVNILMLEAALGSTLKTAAKLPTQLRSGDGGNPFFKLANVDFNLRLAQIGIRD